MTNRFMRGRAPGRAQPAYLRPGSFKQGHEKRGGRKRGTPNLLSIDYKKAILEAAYRIGQDGNGKNGVVGYKDYFVWGCFPRIEWAPAYIGTWRGWRIPFLLSILLVAVGLIDFACGICLS